MTHALLRGTVADTSLPINQHTDTIMVSLVAWHLRIRGPWCRCSDSIFSFHTISKLNSTRCAYRACRRAGLSANWWSSISPQRSRNGKKPRETIKGARDGRRPNPHYSREFVTKPPRRHARRARGAVREGGILETVCWLTERRAPRCHVRRQRACDVERPLHNPGAKKEYRNEFWFLYLRLQ